MLSMDDMRTARSISACSGSQTEGCARDNDTELEGGGVMYVVGEGVTLPEGPASSGDRTREPILLEVAIASRIISAKTSSSVGAGSWLGQSISSEPTARAFPFPLSVLSLRSQSALSDSFEVGRAGEKMIGASRKSDPRIQGTAWLADLSPGSTIDEDKGTLGRPTGGVWSKE